MCRPWRRAVQWRGMNHRLIHWEIERNKDTLLVIVVFVVLVVSMMTVEEEEEDE